MKQQIIWIVLLLLPYCISAQNKQANEINTPTIDWDKATLKQIAPLSGSHTASYARIIQLTNGSLLCVYESEGGIDCTASNDLGNTWQTPINITLPEQGVNMSVPDIIELGDQSLLASFNPRPYKINGNWDTTKHFAIRTKKSYDLGKTWRDERLVYQASYTFSDGCWEPSQIQLPGGEIQLFFSNEGIYTTSNEQNISVCSSMDNGLTWSTKPTIVSFTPKHRDGMPIPIILQCSQQIVFSIEDNAGGQFKPSIIRSLQQHWHKTVGPNDAGRNNALVPQLPDTVYAGAPYLRQLHSGQTILSYQSTVHRNRNWQLACMQVAVGSSNATNFKTVDTPFTIPLDKQGLWNSLCILSDDTIIAVTSTNAYGDNTSIWIIKGKLIDKKN